MSEAPAAPAAPNAAAPTAPASPTAPPSTAAPVTPARPDYVPETFWDATANTIKPEFGSHYGELVKAKQTLDERAALIPDKPDGYTIDGFKLPDTIKPPDGMQIAFDPKDPRLALAREVAMEAGLTQDQFKSLLAFDAKMKIADHAKAIETYTAEDKKLGDNAKVRKDAVSSFLKGLKENGAFTDDEYEAIRPIDAAGVTAFEKLIAKLNGSVGTGGSPPSPPKPGDTPMHDRWYPSQQKAS
jgi:hypothetical protein